jgi:hypothetical protein
MPISPEKKFLRQHSSLPRKVALVIPASAVLVNSQVRVYLESNGLPTNSPTCPPNSFAFDYVDAPLEAEKLLDGATLSDGIYEYLVRDAVLAVFEQPFYADLSLCLAFSNPPQIDILAALRIGQTLDVSFDTKLDQAAYVTKSHFPSEVANCGYGNYPFHVEITGLNTMGFRIVSSFEPQGPTTDSRLPFFMGFRVFGRLATQPQLPIWRDLLGQAVMEALLHRWDHALLFAAFAVEALIDSLLGVNLMRIGFGEEYRDHILKVGDRAHELRALAHLHSKHSRKVANKRYETLNQKVFTPRNRLAHGGLRAASVTQMMATEAIREVVQFIWDWDESSRHLLLIEMAVHNVANLIDEQLKTSCQL